MFLFRGVYIGLTEKSSPLIKLTIGQPQVWSECVCVCGRRLGAEWGTENKFRGPNFRKCPFYENNSILMPKISFLVINSILSFICLSLLSEIWYITYMTLFLTKNLYFRTKHSSMTLLVSSYFASHPITVLLEFSKYWGDGRIIRPHTSNFFLGTIAPKSPPVCVREKAHATACLCMHVDCSLKKNCGNRHKAKSCWKFNMFCTFL